jgi:hypothetical protein
LGNKVREFNLFNPKTENTIETHLASGVYLVRVESEGRVMNVKMVVGR